MYLRQKINNKLVIKNLWQQTLLEMRILFRQCDFAAQRFFPYQYLSVLPRVTLLAGVNFAARSQLAEEIFWYKITGHHICLRRLYEKNGFCPRRGKLVLWGHELSDLIGYGHSGAVYRTVQDYALKVVTPLKIKKLQQEYHLLTGLKHKNIVTAYEIYESADGAGMLLEKLNAPSRDTKGYVRALNFLHKNGVCHGDIRYTNLGADEKGNAKLLDFGNCFYGSMAEMKKEKFDLKLLIKKINTF